MNEFGLSERESDFILIVVRRYSETKRPVPSIYIQKVYPHKISPSGVRYVLNRLEKKGFLKKEHISSGRVPTDLAYKYIASLVIERTSLLEIKNTVNEEYDSIEIDEVLLDQVKMISDKYRSVGFATMPHFIDSPIEIIELYPLPDGRILLLCLTKSNKVFERLLKKRISYSNERLKYVSNYLTKNYRGWTLREIRNHINYEIIREREKIEEWVLDYLSAVSPAIESSYSDIDVITIGLNYIAEIPEVAKDKEVLKEVLDTLEKKEKLLNLIENIMDGEKESVIRLGSELKDFSNPLPLAIISVSYGNSVCGKGVIGMIGSKSIDYKEALKSVIQSAMKINKVSFLKNFL